MRRQQLELERVHHGLDQTAADDVLVLGLQIVLLASFERKGFAHVEGIGTFAIDLNANGRGINGRGAKEVEGGQQEDGEEGGQDEPTSFEHGMPVVAQVDVLAELGLAGWVRQVLLHGKKC